MRQGADLHRRDIFFEVGDFVYLKLQPYRMRTLARHLNEKLRPRFYGPYQITERLGPVAYRLDLPPESRIHPVFHASQLKRCVGPTSTVQQLPQGLSEDRELVVVPEAIRDRRMLLNGEIEVLVQWRGLPEFESTWESLQIMQAQFPDFHLEDKVHFDGGGDDGARGIRARGIRPYAQVYTRRARPKPAHMAQQEHMSRRGISDS